MTGMRAPRNKPVALLLALAIALSLGSAQAIAGGQPLGIQRVDVSEYPVVRVAVTVPPSMGDAEPRFALTENGIDAEKVTASSVSQDEVPAEVMLVIDTSGSMKGEPLDHAKVAASKFIDAMGPNASIAVVAFDDEPRIVTGYTNDRARLDAGISSLMAEGETALYDGLVLAAGLVPEQSQARRSIIVLSDGGDTVSNASFEKTLEVLRTTRVPLYGVALKSDEYNPNALAVLTKNTGGKLVPVSKSSEFTSLFETIAREISNVWTVEYTSSRPRTADIEVDLQATAGDVTAATTVAYRNPGLGDLGNRGPIKVPVVREDPMGLIAVMLLAFLATAMLFGGILLIALRERPNLGQLSYYDQLHEQSPEGASDDLRNKVVDAVGYVAGRRGLTQLASVRLEAAGLPLRPAEYITVHLLLVIAAGALIELTTGRFMLAVGSVLLATAIPLLIVMSMAERRRNKFSEQLPDVLNMVSGSLRAGWGIQQAIALAVQEVPEPSAAEFRRVETETRLGMPLERAMEAMADRMDSDDFRAVVTAIAVQREIGGNLAEVLDIVSKTIREREAVRRQVRALTAEGRLSAYILVALPFVVFGLLMVINPTYILPLLVSPVGIFLLALAIVLLLVGSIWVFAVTKIEV